MGEWVRGREEERRTGAAAGTSGGSSSGSRSGGSVLFLFHAHEEHVPGHDRQREDLVVVHKLEPGERVVILLEVEVQGLGWRGGRSGGVRTDGKEENRTRNARERAGARALTGREMLEELVELLAAAVDPRRTAIDGDEACRHGGEKVERALSDEVSESAGWAERSRCWVRRPRGRWLVSRLGRARPRTRCSSPGRGVSMWFTAVSASPVASTRPSRTPTATARGALGSLW